MKLHYQEPARDYEVRDWLKESLDLTPYQIDKLNKEEIIRFSPFNFYKPRKNKSSFLWRFSILIYPIYFLLLLIALPIAYLLTGRWGFGQKFYDNFHGKWIDNMGF